MVEWWPQSPALAGITVRVVRDMNPDGTARGTRTNARGVDLNRNWPAANFRPSTNRGLRALSETETQAVWEDLTAFDPALVIVFHASRSGPFVNFDGPATLSAQRFVEGAVEHDGRWKVVADMGYATPGSLGTVIGQERGLPILTIEFERDGTAEQAWPSLTAGLNALFGGGP